MPPYIGKKALKLQRIEAERLCLHHRTWTRSFFLDSVKEVETWLLSPERQPIWTELSPDDLHALADVILPERKEDVFAEFYRVNYCRDVMERHAETTNSLAPPRTIYERLVECLFEHSVFSDNHSSDFVSARPLLSYLSLLEVRKRSVRFLVCELEKYTLFCEEDVWKLERFVSVYAWDFMRDHMPSFERLDDFLKSYDLLFANIIGFVRGRDEEMHAQFVNLLFVHKQHEFLVQNHYQVLNASKWTPVAQLVNRPVERIALEANSDYYMCRKCKCKETNVQSLQMRSSDEPATIIVTCVRCHARFTAKN